jgi:hypothetical protein
MATQKIGLEKTVIETVCAIESNRVPTRHAAITPKKYPIRTCKIMALTMTMRVHGRACIIMFRTGFGK